MMKEATVTRWWTAINVVYWLSVILTTVSVGLIHVMNFSLTPALIGSMLISAICIAIMYLNHQDTYVTIGNIIAVFLLLICIFIYGVNIQSITLSFGELPSGISYYSEILALWLQAIMSAIGINFTVSIVSRIVALIYKAVSLAMIL